MRTITRIYSRDGSPTIKLVIEKREREREREKEHLGYGLRERKYRSLVKKGLSLFIMQLSAREDGTTAMSMSRRLTQSYP